MNTFGRGKNKTLATKRKLARQPKPWMCSLCEKEQSPEETKTKVVLVQHALRSSKSSNNHLWGPVSADSQHAQDFQRTRV
jgi:hypothetical protein